MIRKRVSSGDSDPAPKVNFGIPLLVYGFTVLFCKNCHTRSRPNKAHAPNSLIVTPPQRVLRVTKSTVVIIVSDDEEAGPSGTWWSKRPKSPRLGATS